MGDQVDVYKQPNDFKGGAETFNNITDHYHEVNWSRMILCPCKKKDTSAPENDCINCKGIGYIWFGEKKIKGILSSLSVKKNFVQWTEELIGTANFSTKAENKLGLYDKIEIVNGSSIYSQVVRPKVEDVPEVGACKVFTLRYSINEFIKVLEYVNSTTVYNELSFSGDTPIVKKHPIDKFKIYVPNTNNRYDKISVTYLHSPVYLVLDLPNDWRAFRNSKNDFEQYPIKAMLKKMHLIIP